MNGLADAKFPLGSHSVWPVCALGSFPTSQFNLRPVINIIVEDTNRLPRLSPSQTSLRSWAWLAGTDPELAFPSSHNIDYRHPRTRIVTYMHRSQTRTTMAGFSYPCQKGEQINISHHFNPGTELSKSTFVTRNRVACLPHPSPTTRQIYSAKATTIYRITLCYLRAACSNSLSNQHFRDE